MRRIIRSAEPDQERRAGVVTCATGPGHIGDAGFWERIDGRAGEDGNPHRRVGLGVSGERLLSDHLKDVAVEFILAGTEEPDFVVAAPQIRCGHFQADEDLAAAV